MHTATRHCHPTLPPHCYSPHCYSPHSLGSWTFALRPDRLLTTGSLEEKVYQRQLLKGDYSCGALDGAADAHRYYTSDELAQVFEFDGSTFSSTYELQAPMEGQKSRRVCSLLPTPYSLLPTAYSLLPSPYSLLPTPYSVLPTPYSLLLTP